MKRRTRRPSDMCRPCKSGLAPNQPKTFDPGCSRCQEKLAAGLRTGNEPPPSTLALTQRRRLRVDLFEAAVKRAQAASRAKVASGRALQPARGAA